MRRVVSFEALEDSLGSVDNTRRQSSQSGYLDAIGTVRSSFDYLANKDNVIIPLLDCNRVVITRLSVFAS